MAVSGSRNREVASRPEFRVDSFDAPPGVSCHSFTDRRGAPVAERIVVRREAYEQVDPWAVPSSNIGDNSRALSEVPRRAARAPISAPSRVAGPLSGEASIAIVSSDFMTEYVRTVNDTLTSSEVYLNPPSDPSGVLVDTSNMPILCMSTNGRDEVVVGCADHALYAINLTSGTTRNQKFLSSARDTPSPLSSRYKYITMFGKKHGHTDWITGVCHLADNRVLSASMDNRLLLWSASRNTCVELPAGHERSIAKVVSDSRYNVALSCGYDGEVLAWAFGGGGVASRSPPRPAMRLSGHKAPVLECCFNGPTVASGTKEGTLFFWDLTTGELLNKHKAHKNGPVTSLIAIEGTPMFASGGADGLVKLWDPRAPGGAKGSLDRIIAHADSQRSTTGVVTCLAHLSLNGGGDVDYLVSGGSDGNVVVCDVRMAGAVGNVSEVQRWRHHRAPVSALALGGMRGCVFSSDAAGMVLCYDIVGEYIDDKTTSSGSGLRYGLSASSRGGVRTIGCLGGKLIAGGEDGKVLIYEYS
jgi:WD40 repeat protein